MSKKAPVKVRVLDLLDDGAVVTPAGTTREYSITWLGGYPHIQCITADGTQLYSAQLPTILAAKMMLTDLMVGQEAYN